MEAIYKLEVQHASDFFTDATVLIDQQKETMKPLRII